MHSNPNSDPEYLDDALASFADRLMRGEGGEERGPSNRELADLQATAREVKTLFETSRPSAEMTLRIRANLAREWKGLGYGETRPSLWGRMREFLVPAQPAWQSSQRQRRAYAFSLAGLAVLILTLAFALQGGVDTSPGAIPEETPLLLVGLVVAGGFAVMAWRSLRRGK